MKTGKTMMTAAVCMAAGLLSAQMICAESRIKAGSYVGTGNGRNGEVQVEVTVEEDGTITDIIVGENTETPAIAGNAIDVLPGLMTQNQTLNVDSVAGATLTSAGIKSAVKDALTQAGADVEQYQTPVIYETEEKTIDTDIVVVGAGGSGMSAAIEAANAGASVTVVESNAYPGGATLYSGGMVLYAATPEEAEEYGSLDAAGLQEGMKQYAGEAYNSELALDYLNHTKENIDWLKSLYGKNDLTDSHDPGYVPMTPEDTEVSHTLAITIHPTEENGGLVNSWVADTLYQTAVEAGARFLLNTTADELLTDEAGKVSGIHATDNTGNTYVINAKKVILATGGYGGNYEMLKAHTDMEKPFYLGPTSNKGWGIEAGESVHAKTAHSTLPDIEGYNSMVYGTVGGLIVDKEARVLDENDAPIENLFAAGELTCVQALDVVHFSAGENISWNIYSGRIAGNTAAGEL